MAKTHPIIEFTDEELALEEWRPIAGTDDLMFVSSLGRVRSHLRCPDGRILAQDISNGYYRVDVRVGQGRPNRRVHSLVAEAFLGPRPPGEEVNHKDCNGLNNRVTNLEWVTPNANREHYSAYCAANGISQGRPCRITGAKFSHGGTGLAADAHRRGRITCAKLTPASVAEIRAKRAAGAKLRELAAEHGVSITAIFFLLSGRTWSWV